jgi:nickel/cobalt exporter
MIDPSTILVLITGLSLGILHAFDADHIMAVSSLSKRNFSAKKLAMFCGRWAMGHGATVCILSLLLIFFGWQLGETVSIWAERLIGVMLLCVGVLLVFRFIKSKPELAIKTHHHHDGTQHTHLVKKDNLHENHLPILVGIVHGIAGSAPLLALLPSLIAKAPVFGVGYVLIFSLGVLLSMLGFGLALGYMQSILQQRSEKVFNYAKALIGLGASVLGGYWILGSL